MNKWRPLAGCVAILLLVVVLLAACGPEPQPSPTGPAATATVTTTVTASATTTPAPQVIRWKGQSTFATGVAYGPFPVEEAGNFARALGFTKWLEQATGGRLVVDWSPAGAIFPITETDQAVAKGVVQIAQGYASYYAARIPEGDIETVPPFAFEDEDQEFEAMTRYGMMKILQDVYAAKNLFWLPEFTHAIIGIGTNFPPPNPEAFKGRKIRTTGLWADYVNLLGAAPVTIPIGETYQALKLGTAEGWTGGVAFLEENKFKEVTKYIVYSPSINNSTANILINMDAFKALPADIQNLIRTTGHLVTYAMSTKWRNQCTWVLRQAESQGVQLVAWSPEDTAKVTKLAVDNIYPKLAAKSAASAQLMDIIKNSMKTYGRLK